jgi:hypothetical protein
MYRWLEPHIFMILMKISGAGRHSVRLYAGLTMTTILIFSIAEGLLPDLSANILVVG